jgi:hypothetical protein
LDAEIIGLEGDITAAQPQGIALRDHAGQGEKKGRED